MEEVSGEHKSRRFSDAISASSCCLHCFLPFLGSATKRPPEFPCASSLLACVLYSPFDENAGALSPKTSLQWRRHCYRSLNAHTSNPL